MTKRLFAAIGIGLAVLLLAITLLLAWLLGTQSGSRMLWGGVSGAVDGLAAESVGGSLGGPLSLGGLRFETDTMLITIGSLQLDWSPSALLRREVRLAKLHVEDVAYTQLKPAPPAQADDSEPFSLPEQISLPVAVELRNIVLRSFEYRSAPGAEPVRVDEATLAASFRGNDLAIDQLSAQGPLFRVDAVASVRTRGDYASTAAVDWQASLPELAPLGGSLSVDGDLSAMRIEQTLEAPYSSTQKIRISDLLDDGRRLDARVDLDNIRLQDIGDTLPLMTLAGTLRADGSVTDLDYQADLTVDSPEFGDLALAARGGLSDQVVAIDQFLLTREPGDARLEIAGQANLAGASPTFELAGNWRDLAWPLIGEPRISSGSGRFTVDGSPENYRVDLNTALSVPGQADGQLTLSGSGDDEAFELASLQLALLDGSLTGRGNVRWSPEIRGALTLDGEGLNPAVLAPDYPGNLQISLRAAGGVTDGAAQAQIDTLALSGTFREQPLDVQVKGEFRDARLSLDTLTARSGDTRVNAAGHVGDSMDLDWDIDSPDLGDLLPGASGSLSGAGRLAGSLPLPVVSGSLQGDSITYAAYQLSRLSLELDIDLQREAPSQLQLTLDEARLGDVEIRRASVSGTGNRADHQLELAVDSSAGAAQLTLAGDLQDKGWVGELRAGELQYPDLAAWNLDSPQPLRLSADSQSLERGCWRSGDAILCLQGQRVAGDIDAALSLETFSLDYLRSMIPDAFSLAGVIDAQASFRQGADASPEIGMTLAADGVELRTGESAEQPDELLLGLEPSTVSMNYADSGLLAEVSLPFTGGGGIDASAQVGEGSDPLAERPLSGKLALALNDIGFLRVLSSEIEQAKGALSGDFDLGGTLATPSPAGELRLADGQLELAGPGLNISDIGVRVSSSGGSALDFDGRATSGEGTLQLGGSAQLDGARTRVDIDIDGKRFEVVNTVDARVFVSPDLQVSVRESGIVIKGDVVVPRAEITPKELPASVVTASSDEVVVTDDSEEGVAAAAPRELEARIRLVLGDAVSIDGFGLKARLAGGITVTQAPGQPTLGSGEVNILDGEYRAYGQGLVIDTGKILFAGGPIAEPGINVRALRRPAEGIVVGVSARGPLQNPDFSVFSEPAMTQSEQLSWLVLGRPLAGASEGESDMITQAALALGLRGGNFLADRLGGSLGVDSVGIETGSGEAGAASDVNQAAFVIGKYLSPDLFVSYGIGLFDSVSTVRLEYTLSEHWKVSTESSTISSGGDVTYTIER